MLIIEFPKIITPPHRPALANGKSVGSSVSSNSDVKIIGFSFVPFALIFPPLAMIKADAFSASPCFPLITVPASMFNTEPSSTNTNPSRIYVLFAVIL